MVDDGLHPMHCGVPMIHNDSFMEYLCMGCGRREPCGACRRAFGREAEKT